VSSAIPAVLAARQGRGKSGPAANLTRPYHPSPALLRFQNPPQLSRPSRVPTTNAVQLVGGSHSGGVAALRCPTCNQRARTASVARTRVAKPHTSESGLKSRRCLPSIPHLPRLLVHRQD